ncbi:MAG: hypothetical protein HYV28_08470 [Ignavibacteriales bacterium]|nr:hypothetical protein [Ignavibacteriales bacterium]
MFLKNLLAVLMLLTCLLSAQSAYIYTYVDYKNQDARIAIQNEKTGKSFDVGFIQSHLPIWAGNEVIFNGQNTIWKCDREGENLRRISPGFRASLSHDGSKYACYTGEGITVFDTSGKMLKILDLTPWIDITITWKPGDSVITYFSEEKQSCMMYFLNNDSISTLGKRIYQPTWNSHGICLYNKLEESGMYQVYTKQGGRERKISFDDRMAVVPSWSNSGKAIAYLSVLPDSVQPGNTDMYVSELMLYETATGNTTILTSDAGFNDKVFPQLAFSEDDSFIYYTAVAENGNGKLKKINARTLESFVLREGAMIDCRFPTPDKPGKK